MAHLLLIDDDPTLIRGRGRSVPRVKARRRGGLPGIQGE